MAATDSSKCNSGSQEPAAKGHEPYTRHDSPCTGPRAWQFCCSPDGSGLEQGGELLGVGLGVVAVAVVEQHVGLPGVAGQDPHPGCPLRQLGLAVAVAEPLVNIAAVPLVRVPMQADHGQV